MTVALLSGPSNGTAAASGGVVVYTPNPDFNGTDGFTYQVSDGFGGTDTAAVTIRVWSVNDPPTANNDEFSGSEDTAITGNVLGNDEDSHNSAPDENNLPLTTQLVSGPGNAASFSLGSDGTFTYTPALNWNSSESGPVSFSYVAIDAKGGVSNPATVTIWVEPVNDATIAHDDAWSLDEDSSGTYPGSVLDNDDDDHGGAPAEDNYGDVVLVSGPTHAASFGLDAGGGFSYSPVENFNGSDSFTYKVVDSYGDISNVATVTITVNSVNDPPLAETAWYDISPNTTLSGAVVVDDSQGGAPSENNLPLTVSLYNAPAFGQATVNADGTFTYTPNEGFVGGDSFDYKVMDSLGGVSYGTVTMWVEEPGLFIAGQPVIGQGNAEEVTRVEVESLLAVAGRFWEAALRSSSLAQRLAAIEVKVADLNGFQLGSASSHTITIDNTAAGYGWFIDSTPEDNAEFGMRISDSEMHAAEGSAAYGKVDLLTVLIHEMGHVLGFEHGDEDDVMGETLGLGTRHGSPCPMGGEGGLTPSPQPSAIEWEGVLPSPRPSPIRGEGESLPTLLTTHHSLLTTHSLLAPVEFELPPESTQRVPDQPAFPVVAEYLQDAAMEESDFEPYWLASSGPEGEAVLIGGEGTDIVIGLPGRDVLVGGIA